MFPAARLVRLNCFFLVVLLAGCGYSDGVDNPGPGTAGTLDTGLDTQVGGTHDGAAAADQGTTDPSGDGGATVADVGPGGVDAAVPVDVGPQGCTPDQCTIDGQCHDNGTADPANPCLACVVLANAAAWTANDAASCDDGDKEFARTFVMLPVGAGEELTGPDGDGIITVITPSSPVGRAMKGKRTGDVAEVTIKREPLEWEIIEVCC